MKHIFKSITVVLLVFSASNLNAQSEDLDFTLQSNSIEMDGDSTVIESNMKKEGNQFVWTQKIGENESVLSYSITYKTEQWDSGNSLGSIEYTLEINGFESTLIISGDSNGVTAELSSITTNGQTEKLTFNISTITYN